MKEENEITEEVKQLLDSLEQHGRNARRQKELGDLIDQLERRTENEERRTLNLSWWIVGAAAACLLLWLLAKPAMREAPNNNEEILVEETGTKDTMTTQKEVDLTEETVILEEPIPEKLLAEETPSKTTKPQPKTHKQPPKAVEENSEEPVLAENTATESTKTETIDTLNIGSITTPSSAEENPSTLNSPLSTLHSQRRVVRSLNLVCYECKTENGERKTENSPLSTFHLPLEPDPNMKNGSLAFELKLH